MIAFYGLNGCRLTLTNDAAYDLVMAVVSGTLDDVEGIAGILSRVTTTWLSPAGDAVAVRSRR